MFFGNIKGLQERICLWPRYMSVNRSVNILIHNTLEFILFSDCILIIVSSSCTLLYFISRTVERNIYLSLFKMPIYREPWNISCPIMASIYSGSQGLYVREELHPLVRGNEKVASKLYDLGDKLIGDSGSLNRTSLSAVNWHRSRCVPFVFTRKGQRGAETHPAWSKPNTIKSWCLENNHYLLESKCHSLHIHEHITVQFRYR